MNISQISNAYAILVNSYMIFTLNVHDKIKNKRINL